MAACLYPQAKRVKLLERLGLSAFSCSLSVAKHDAAERDAAERDAAERDAAERDADVVLHAITDVYGYSRCVLAQVNAPADLRNCIFGEATLNDALSIVLFQVIRQRTKDFNVSYFLSHVGGSLCWMLAGSTAVGTLLTLLGAYLTRRLLFLRLAVEPLDGEVGGHGGHGDVAHMELALLATFALLTYSMAERLAFSGIMALFVGGALSRHYTYHNLSAGAQKSATSFFLTLAAFAETSLSTLLGVAAFDFLTWAPSLDLSFAALTVPILFFTRALNIVPLSMLANACRPRRKRISAAMQVVMCFSGMRGALSFALVVTLIGPHTSISHELFHQYVGATLTVIVFTTLLLSPCTPLLIRALKLGNDGGNKGVADAFMHLNEYILDYPSPEASTITPPAMHARVPRGPFTPLAAPLAQSPQQTPQGRPRADPPGEQLAAADPDEGAASTGGAADGRARHIRQVLRKLEQVRGPACANRPPGRPELNHASRCAGVSQAHLWWTQLPS